MKSSDDKKVDTVQNNKEFLNEFRLSWAGKIFFAGAASYILGRGLQKVKLPIKIRGTPTQMKAMVGAVVASKAFQKEISKPGATIEQVIEKLNLKNITKNQFERLTGREWPL